MNNKLAIAIAALMVAALAAPAVMADDVSYSATVVTSDVIVTPVNTTFGGLLAGTSKEITGSLTLENNGGAAANVDAKFTTPTGGPTYGLDSGTNVIGGSNFQIGTNGDEVTLNDAGTDTPLGANNQVPASGSASYDAILNVPSEQAAGDYTGNVQLTFTTVV